MDPALATKPMNPVAAARNMQAAAIVKTLVAVVSGAAVGILGLKGTSGFVVYAAQHIAVSLVLLHNAKWKPSEYFPGSPSASGFVAGSALDQVLTYVLMWTLSYALVHIY